MKLVKSLLLGSAATIAVVAGAQAADLPSRKAAPASYVKICDAYGAGFFYIPGTDTCVRLGGYVRFETQYTPGQTTYSLPAQTVGVAPVITPATPFNVVLQPSQNQSTFGWESRGRIDVDARTPTALGTARTFIRLRLTNNSGLRRTTITDRLGYTFSDPSTQGSTLESAMVQWAGFTFGIAPENYAMMPSFMYDANPWAGFPNGMKQIAYTATFGGGFSATIALEDRQDWAYAQFSNTAAFGTDRLSTGANIVGNIRLDQAWGFAAIHGVVGNDALQNAALNGQTVIANPGITTQTGFGIGATASFKLPMIAAGDQIWIGANYAKGLIGALLSAGGLNNLSNASGSRSVGGITRVDTALVATGGLGTVASPFTFGQTTGWNVNAAYTHYWAAQWRSNFTAGYVQINPPTSNLLNTWGKGTVWEVAGSIIYSPAKDFDIGLEAQYINLKNNVQNPTLNLNGLSQSTWTSKLRVERSF